MVAVRSTDSENKTLNRKSSGRITRIFFLSVYGTLKNRGPTLFENLFQCVSRGLNLIIFEDNHFDIF